MFGLFGGAKKPLKGYKITTVERKQKYGIAANSLKMLKDKASDKFKVRVISMGFRISSFDELFVYKDSRLSCLFGQRWN